MDYRIGYRRPRSAASLARQKRRRVRWAWSVAALATLVATVAALMAWSPAEREVRARPAAAKVASDQPQAGAPARLVYPFSVVPGGVGSREEVAKAVAADKVVAGHYASFDVSRARAVALQKSRWVHVSYRMGDKVYWTAKKVRLAAGETVITDGEHEIRGRCGNRISEAPRAPVSAHEPPAQELDSPTLVGGYDEIVGRRPGEAPAPTVEAPQPAYSARSFGGFIPPTGYLAPIAPGATPSELPPGATVPPGDLPPATTIPPGELPPGATAPPGEMPPGSTIPPIDFPPGPTIPPGGLPPGATLPPPQGEVPEPAALWLLGIGAAVMLASRRRRPKKGKG